MKKIFPPFYYLLFFIVVLSGCAQTKQYTPHTIGTQYNLSGMPADLICVQVNDLRAERENSEQLLQVIKGQILSALSSEKTNGNRAL
jgi:dTDP-4-amino-4,6-dideoxygalactose transaminase